MSYIEMPAPYKSCAVLMHIPINSFIHIAWGVLIEWIFEILPHHLKKFPLIEIKLNNNNQLYVFIVSAKTSTTPFTHSPIHLQTHWQQRIPSSVLLFKKSNDKTQIKSTFWQSLRDFYSIRFVCFFIHANVKFVQLLWISWNHINPKNYVHFVSDLFSVYFLLWWLFPIYINCRLRQWKRDTTILDGRSTCNFFCWRRIVKFRQVW